MQFTLTTFTPRGSALLACVALWFGIAACSSSKTAPEDAADEGDGSGGGESGGSGGSAGSGGSDASNGGLGGNGTPAGGSGGAGKCATNLVCDDFESYPVGAFKSGNGWTVHKDTVGPELTIDESRARSGKRSIKITASRNNEKELIITRTVRDVLKPSKNAYMRMMFYLDALPQGQDLHWTFIRAAGYLMQGGASGNLLHNLGGQPSGQVRNLMLWPTPVGLQDCYNDSREPKIPVKKWTCLEWHLDRETQTTEVWFDGQKLMENSFTTRPEGGGCQADQTGGKWIIPEIFFMHFGWINYHEINGAQMWIDDIAIDSKRIGCPQ